MNEQRENGLGLAGLIFSILGWLTCGLLSIPGVILSLMGLSSPGPKGTSIAGVIVGLPGVLFILFMLGSLALGLGIPFIQTLRPDRQETTETVAEPSAGDFIEGMTDGAARILWVK